MVIDTPDWNKDKFGNNIERGTSGTDIFERRETTKFNPIIGETLGGYTRRMMPLIYNQEQVNMTAHTRGKKVWFTHRTPSECWICHEINIMWMLYEVLNLLPNPEKWVFADKDKKIVLTKVKS